MPTPFDPPLYWLCAQAELRQREREWSAQQEARKREAARRQAQAAAAAQAKLEEEQALQAQIVSTCFSRISHWRLCLAACCCCCAQPQEVPLLGLPPPSAGLARLVSILRAQFTIGAHI